MKRYIQMCAVLSTAALMTLWCKLMILHQVWHELASGPVYVNTLYKLYIQLQVCLVQSIPTKNVLFRPAEPTCLLEVKGIFFLSEVRLGAVFHKRDQHH